MKENIDFLLKSEEEKEQGNILFKNGDYELAIFHYTRSINYAPHSSILYTNRSLAYFKIGNFDKSLEDALKAQKLDEDNLKSYYRICEVYKALNDEENYKKYLELYNNKRNNKNSKEYIEDPRFKEENKKFSKKENLKNKISNKLEIKKNEIKKSNELIDFGEKNEDKFLFFNISKNKEIEKNIKFEKEQYKNNFLIEEVYDFKKKEDKKIVDNNKKKYDISDKYILDTSSIYDDICVSLNTFHNFFSEIFPLAIHIQKESKIKNSYDKYDIESLKNKADILFSQKKFYTASEIYNDIIHNYQNEKSIYYCTILSNRSACFIEMKKIRSSLCDICRTLSILFSFFKEHKENLKKKLIELEEKKKDMFDIDLKIYKDCKGIYSQAHKLLIKLLFRYIKFCYLHKKKFYVPSLNQVDIFGKLKGKHYINNDELEKLKNTIYSKL
ncbi:conserved Plasmodium protein, unknown function [Plasmodium gallinaceum]|uniref:Uncharacterized protein n=1 Tax=Plasmodium gallinaceum TaxID=5849 RepID=A0A1J1GPH4_PLAGA|nr:conserved Plasmodium protein, unknown function [Plasmodium gallinaceum]CRG94338.1 conserved Plasmodium protein, unknown function [Plasmodium gallinaceum]